jgi:hypothetical protein
MQALKQCLQNSEVTKNPLLKPGEQYDTKTCSQHENKSVYKRRTVRRQSVNIMNQYKSVVNLDN